MPDSAQRRVPQILRADATETGPPADDILRGLSAPDPAIPPRFFYDEQGSRLFAAITALEEYYPTRTEAALLTQHLPDIADACADTGTVLIDLGAGNCEKAARLFEFLAPEQYVAVDISVEFLRCALGDLQRRYPELALLGVATDFSRGLVLPAQVAATRRLFFYPGSSIGNFTPAEAGEFLAGLRPLMDERGALLIGVDLIKEAEVLERAYDDALGVTAAFNLNILRHANRLAGTDFRVEDWRHVACFNRGQSRIEMHLEARRALQVRWPGGGRRFAAGERIHTENSCKYTPDSFRALLQSAGYRGIRHWTDERGWFGMFLARP
ncbi:MAG TPA: L-histidine N(alpha)-methyltransferase [Burkholderiales bacterium]|nr:L-histidine N(alpha)-methyltransferase [Burkholderiales bacterium]